MRHLIIIGARGCGRETYALFLECKKKLGDVECIGFLDSDPHILDDFTNYPPIISSPEEYQPKPDDVFITALGDPHWVKHYSEMIESKGGKFISLISPYAAVSGGAEIGFGCIISGLTLISSDVTIGKHSNIGIFSVIGHDVCIADYCHIGAYTFIGGGCQIGQGVTLHPKASIIPHKKIGDNAIVGIASTVLRNVKPNTTVFGSPATAI